MNKKRIYKDLNLELGMGFLQAKHVKALEQQQYDLVIGE